MQPQDDDNEPDYSIASIDCIESQHSGEDYDLDIGTGQRPQDHSHDSEQVAAHDRGPLMPPGATGAAQRSICEEVNESDDSPEAGSPLCGAAVARRPAKSAASKYTRGSKGTKGSKVRPTITVSIHAPRMRDMNKSPALPLTFLPNCHFKPQKMNLTNNKSISDTGQCVDATVQCFVQVKCTAQKRTI